jgi:hypothetical protein
MTSVSRDVIDEGGQGIIALPDAMQELGVLSEPAGGMCL